MSSALPAGHYIRTALLPTLAATANPCYEPPPIDASAATDTVLPRLRYILTTAGVCQRAPPARASLDRFSHPLDRHTDGSDTAGGRAPVGQPVWTAGYETDPVFLLPESIAFASQAPLPQKSITCGAAVRRFDLLAKERPTDNTSAPSPLAATAHNAPRKIGTN